MSQLPKLKFFSFTTFKLSLKMINPIVITLLGAIFVSVAITLGYFPPGSAGPPPINPVHGENPNDPVGTAGISLANAIIYVSIVLVGGVIFVILLKYGFSKILEIIIGLTMGLSSFFFTFMILPSLLSPILTILHNNGIFLFGTTQAEFDNRFFIFVFTVASLLAIIYVFGLIFDRFKNQYLHNTLMILFAISMGSIFGIFFETVSLIVVLIALSLYDIYAVFKGPLKSMFDNLNEEDELFEDETRESDVSSELTTNAVVSNQKSSEHQFFDNDTTKDVYVRIPSNAQKKLQKGITLPIYTTPYISIGLGDFVFFSVLVAKTTYFALRGGDLFLLPIVNGSIYWGLIIFPVIGVLLGCYITFIMLQKYEVLPALPFPIFGGLSGLFFGIILHLLL